MTWGWHADALRALHELSLTQELITSDDLHDKVPAPTASGKWGAVFEDARKLGFIKATGAIVHSRRGPSKGRNIQVWRSACFTKREITDYPAAYHEQLGLDHSNQMSLDESTTATAEVR